MLGWIFPKSILAVNLNLGRSMSFLLLRWAFSHSDIFNYKLSELPSNYTLL